MPDVAYGTSRQPHIQPPGIGASLFAARAGMMGGGPGQGYGSMSRWFRKKPGEPGEQPQVDERGLHVGAPIQRPVPGPGSQITDYTGLANRRLWDPEARADFTDRNQAFNNERLRGLSMAGLRWAGTKGAPRGGMMTPGAGFEGQPDDLRRRILSLLSGGGL